MMLPVMRAVSPSVQEGEPLQVTEMVSVENGEPLQVAEVASMDQERADAVGRVDAVRRGRMEDFMVAWCID